MKVVCVIWILDECIKNALRTCWVSAIFFVTFLLSFHSAPSSILSQSPCKFNCWAFSRGAVFYRKMIRLERATKNLFNDKNQCRKIIESFLDLIKRNLFLRHRKSLGILWIIMSKFIKNSQKQRLKIKEKHPDREQVPFWNENMWEFRHQRPQFYFIN